MKLDTYIKGQSIYDIVFNYEYKSTWIHRISENENLEDFRLIKKSVSYDITIPEKLYPGLDRADYTLLPLFLTKKTIIKNIDAKINNNSIPVTTKNTNKLMKMYLLDYLENMIVSRVSYITNADINNIKKYLLIKNIKRYLRGSNNTTYDNAYKIINTYTNKKIEYNSDKILSDYIGKYINCKAVLENSYIFSVILPSEYTPGDRAIIKIYLEIPQGNHVPHPPWGPTHTIDRTPLPAEGSSHHITYEVPPGLRLVNFKIVSKSKNENIITTNNSLYFNDSNYIDVSSQNPKTIRKEDTLSFDVLPIRQGIRRHSFWASILISLSILLSVIYRFPEHPDFYSRSAPTASIVVAISAFLISWFSRTEDLPLLNLIQGRLKLILLAQAGCLYASAALLIIAPAFPIWDIFWFCIYMLSAASNIYSIYLNYNWIQQERRMEISYGRPWMLNLTIYMSLFISISLIIMAIILLCTKFFIS